MRNRWLIGVLTGVVVAALALGVYWAATTYDRGAQAQEVRQPSGIGVSVSGEGSVDARPDTAYVNLGFQTENSSVETARQEAAQQMNAVLARIKALGVDEKDIQTSNYSIWRDTERDVFVVSNTVQVTIRRIDPSGRLLDEAVKAGANNVNGISFGIEDRAALERQARERALQNARAKAEELARLAGVQIGNPISISEGAQPPIIYEPMAVGQAAAAEDARTPIEPGQQKVTINVEVTYAIR